MAKSPVAPIVIPIFHKGMDNVLPHRPDNQLVSPFPQRGQDVTIKVGDPVVYNDLTEQYNIDIQKCQTREERRARRRQYYHDLTERVDESLAALENDLFHPKEDPLIVE